MRKTQASRLPLRSPLPYAIYHDSGKLLHNFGEVLTTKHTHLLGKAGIEEVWLADRLDRPARIQEDLKVKTITVLAQAKAQIIARPVYGGDDQLIADVGTKVTEDVYAQLSANEVKSVTVSKRENELNLGQVSAYLKLVEKHITGNEPIPGFGDTGGAEGLMAMARQLAALSALEAKGPAALRNQQTGDPLSKRLPPLDPTRTRTREELDAQRKVYETCAQHIESLFKDLIAGKPVTKEDLDPILGEMLRASLKDRALLLAIMHQPREGEFIYTHTINVFTLVVNLAILLDYDERLLREACYAALFADSGLLMVSEAVRNKKEKLTDEELREIRNHPMHSVAMAAKIQGLPEMLPLILFQTHEMLDGSGYPRGKKGDDIHDLAKVIGVADCYAGMIAPRPYRKAEQPYKALEEVIRRAGQRRFDGKPVRALLQAIGLFPVGSWVRMSDASTAVVVCPNQTEYARPHVRLILDRMGKPVAGFPLVTAEMYPGLHIERATEGPAGVPALLAFFQRQG